MTGRVETTVTLLHRPFTGLLKISFCVVFLFLLTAEPGLAAPGKDDDRNKVIIRITSADGTKKYIGDLLGGMDPETGKGTDRVAGSIKIGIFAEEDEEGELKNVKYQKKVMYPKKDFKPGTIQFIKRAYLYKDLVDAFKKKLKTSKATKDKVLRRQKLLRLLSWCDANYLPSFKAKVEKELKKLDPDVVEEEKSSEFFKYDEKQKKIVDVLQGLTDIGRVSLASSEHITVASDFLPVKTIERMLKTGERIYRDFTEIMYVDGIKDLRKIPEGEICRIYFLKHTTTLEDALRNRSKLAPGLADIKHAESLRLTLHLGGEAGSATRPKTQTIISYRFTALETRDLDDPEDLTKIKKRPESADYTTSVIGSLSNAMMDNWLGKPAAFKGRITMPWLSQGFSHYVCITNLGERGPSTTDFDFSYARKEGMGLGYRWEGDIEETMHRVAQDPTADKIEDLFRISHYRNLKTESVAKAVSLIDFLMENNKLGFLNFLKDLQKHYRKLDKTGNQTAFIKGLDPLFARHFGAGSTEDSGMSSRLKKRSSTIDSVEAMERAWRDWAMKWVNKKKRRD